MGLDWAATQELIKRTGAEAAAVGGALAVRSRHGPARPRRPARRDRPVSTGPHRCLPRADRRGHGCRRQGHPDGLAGAGPGRRGRADDYRDVYETLLRRSQPTRSILHWLGTMFDPALDGYWGSADVAAATEIFADLIQRPRRQGRRGQGLPAGRRPRDGATADWRRCPGRCGCTPGDDFNYPELIDGDGTHHSDALLGIFAAIYPAASTALQAYDAGRSRRGAGDPGLHPGTRPAHFRARPPYYYKTGIAFLSWLNGQQPAFSMVGGLQAGRSVPHLVQIFRLADRAGLLPDPELAARRMQLLLSVQRDSRADVSEYRPRCR